MVFYQQFKRHFSQGQYCYKPNLQASCCPQYTIKFYDIPLLPWIIVDSRPKIRCDRIQAFQKPKTDSQSVGHLVLILTSSLSYAQCASIYLDGIDSSCMMVRMTQWNWTMRSTSLHRCGDRSLYITNSYFYPILRSPHASKTFTKPKKAASITSLNVAIHESEINFQTGIQPCHRFEVRFHHLLNLSSVY